VLSSIQNDGGKCLLTSSDTLMCSSLCVPSRLTVLQEVQRVRLASLACHTRADCKGLRNVALTHS
jgi:hypothetical protein